MQYDVMLHPTFYSRIHSAHNLTVHLSRKGMFSLPVIIGLVVAIIVVVMATFLSFEDAAMRSL
jgi:hypothetical protein